MYRGRESHSRSQADSQKSCDKKTSQDLKGKEPGIKWIKAGDFYGVLVHDKRSGVILKGAWADDWKEQGYQGIQRQEHHGVGE